MLHYFFHAQNPPHVNIDSDLDFVLRVAFGSGTGNFAQPASGCDAWHWAERLGLGDRLVAVLGTARAQTLLGTEVAEPLNGARERARSDASARAEVQQHLERAIGSSGIEVVLLRNAAHECDRGSVAGGTDLDILVRDTEYQCLFAELLNAGCVTTLRRVPWSARKGGGLVISGQAGAALVTHRELRFLRMVPGGVFIDLDCLKRCGQLFRDDVTPKNLWLPSKSVQAADVVAQLLVEQRFSPESAAFRALLIAQRLGLAHDEDLAFDAYLMLQTDVEHAEFAALRELLGGLGEGKVVALSKRARTLLDHFIAASTIPSYRARLQLQRKAQVWQHEGHLERAAEKVGKVLARATRR